MFLAAITTPDSKHGYSYSRAIHLSAKFETEAEALAWCKEYSDKLLYVDIVKSFKFTADESDSINLWVRRNPKPTFELREPKATLRSELTYEPSEAGWINIIRNDQEKLAAYLPAKAAFDQELAVWQEKYDDKVRRAQKKYGPKWSDGEYELLKAIPYQNRSIVYYEIP